MKVWWLTTQFNTPAPQKIQSAEFIKQINQSSYVLKKSHVMIVILIEFHLSDCEMNFGDFSEIESVF